jgi:Lipid A 3-O-deacylase (PagL)
MRRSAIGVAVLALVLSGGGEVLAQPIPQGRPPEWGLAAGYGFDVRVGPGTSDFGLAILTPSVGFRLSSRFEFVSSATFERYAGPAGYYLGLLPAGARLSIGNDDVLPYFGFGVGFGWTDLTDLPELSRRFNFRIECYGGLRMRIDDATAWTLEARYQHTSNAGTSFPNQGINSVVVLAGWRFR